MVLFCIGILILIASIVMFIILMTSAPVVREDFPLLGFLIFIGIMVALIFSAIGAILFFVGKSRNKKQKNQNP